MQPEEMMAIRLTLSLVWLVTGFCSIWLYPMHDSLELLAKVGIFGAFAVFTLYAEAVLDMAIGLLTLVAPSKTLWLLQGAVVGGYSLVIAVFLPEYLTHPFGPILKNLPIFTLIWLLYRNQGVRNDNLLHD